ncbi:MAG: hypothetical protein WAU89_07660 [Candidatus Acidiferrales bacterium]
MDRSRGFADFVVAMAVLMAVSGALHGSAYRTLSGTDAGLGREQAEHTEPQTSKSQAQSQAPAPAPEASATHSITLTFDYDFTKTPACSPTVKAHCVAKFSVYDISSHKPYFLFYAPVPEGAHGVTKGITATSPRLLFAVGKHRIAVSAVAPDGLESPPHECKTIIEIKAAGAADTSVAH